MTDCFVCGRKLPFKEIYGHIFDSVSYCKYHWLGLLEREAKEDMLYWKKLKKAETPKSVQLTRRFKEEAKFWQTQYLGLKRRQKHEKNSI